MALTKPKRNMQRKGLAPIPRSTAKTAWGLLQDVKRAMREEPRRVDMDTWLRRMDPRNLCYECYEAPACGTVGCFAGWVVLLAGGSPRTRPFNVESKARSILGENCNYDLGPFAKDVFAVYDGCLSRGTRHYVEDVIKTRIDPFMKMNMVWLKRRRLPRPSQQVKK